MNMNKLISFVKQYTKSEIPEISQATKIGRSYYLIGKDQEEVMGRLALEPVSAGLFLGELKDSKFRPGFPLIDIIAKKSDRKAVVGQKGETLFLYRNNLFQETVKSFGADEGPVIVCNERGEALGIGEVREARGQKIIKHILDRSDFLKRESRR